MRIHAERHLTSGKLLPTWALFAFAGGAVNAGALLACDRFVSHVTGTVTRIGLDAGGVLALDYALVLLAFLAGATAALVLVRRTPRGDAPAYWLPLGIVSTILVTVAGAGHFGLIGRFGGSVETARDFALLAVLGFAMGMQNAAVAASTGMTVRTTHMTGPVTDIGVALATLLSGGSEERAGARKSLMLRFTKLASFIGGAAVMSVLCPRVGWLGFLLPCAAGVAAIARSYLPTRESAGRGNASPTSRA